MGPNRDFLKKEEKMQTHVKEIRQSLEALRNANNGQMGDLSGLWKAALALGVTTLVIAIMLRVLTTGRTNVTNDGTVLGNLSGNITEVYDAGIVNIRDIEDWFPVIIGAVVGAVVLFLLVRVLSALGRTSEQGGQ